MNYNMKEKEEEKMIAFSPSEKMIDYFEKKYGKTPLIHAQVIADYFNIPVSSVDETAGIVMMHSKKGIGIKDDGNGLCFLSPNSILFILQLFGKLEDKDNLTLDERRDVQYLFGKSMLEASKIDDKIVVEERQEENLTTYNIKLKDEVEG